MRPNKPFTKMHLLDIYNFLEDLDYEASILNKSVFELLEKEKIEHKIPKDIFVLMNQTLQSMKKGEITLNGETVKPFEKEETPNHYIEFAIPVEDSYRPKSKKDLGGWLDNLEDWEVKGFGINGTEFASRTGNNSFYYDVIRGVISENYKSTTDRYTFNSDFTHVLNIPEQGLYLLRDVLGRLEGVAWIRYSKEEANG